MITSVLDIYFLKVSAHALLKEPTKRFLRGKKTLKIETIRQTTFPRQNRRSPIKKIRVYLINLEF